MAEPQPGDRSIPSFARAELLRDGMTVQHLRALATSGRLSRVRRGSYASCEDWNRIGSLERHLVRIRDIGGHLGGGAAISHLSAAVLLGIPLPAQDLPRVQVTWPMSPGRRGTTNIHPYRGRIETTNLIEVEGILVTDGARTAFDVARTEDPRTAVVVADGALRLGLCSVADFRATLDTYPNTPGAVRARRILEFANGLSDSVGESISRVQFAQIGLPAPAIQVPIADASGEVFARADFEFTEFATVGEFDGRQKYVRYLRPGQTASDVVWAEKLREDRIRETGREVVRLTWSDLTRSASVLERFRSAFARAGHPGWRPGPRRFVTSTTGRWARP